MIVDNAMLTTIDRERRSSLTIHKMSTTKTWTRMPSFNNARGLIRRRSTPAT